MIQLTHEQTQSLTSWFLPDLPGVAPGLHVIQTGQGRCYVDRWPHPQAGLFDAGGNYSLVGDVNALTVSDLVDLIHGFVETDESFVQLLHQAFGQMERWERVMYDLNTAPRYHPVPQTEVRLLTADDAQAVRNLSGKAWWIWKTWGTPERFASSGYVWGAFMIDRLVSVACTFFVGIRFEEIGIITESDVRGLGLAAYCAGKLCEDIQRRGKIPSWTTSPDNKGSLRLAEKLDFQLKRQIPQYVIGVDIPSGE
ncbi:MAG: GNAT family N-acetyltransferase [Chloroflexota bacterium]